eukprot:COSAG02_NODE_62676_length_265_cov_0.626506_1_plen_61_part_10
MRMQHREKRPQRYSGRRDTAVFSRFCNTCEMRHVVWCVTGNVTQFKLSSFSTHSEPRRQLL